MSEEQIKDMILKQCLELTTNNDFRPPISAYDGIDIDDVVRTCKQLQDKKTYLDLVKENQELKNIINQIGFEPDEIAFLQQENAELKKQVEEKENIACNWKDSCLENAGKIEELETQQKEFIKFLEENYKETQDIWYIKILQKYKSIIGDDK